MKSDQEEEKCFHLVHDPKCSACKSGGSYFTRYFQKKMDLAQKGNCLQCSGKSARKCGYFEGSFAQWIEWILWNIMEQTRDKLSFILIKNDPIPTLDGQDEIFYCYQSNSTYHSRQQLWSN